MQGFGNGLRLGGVVAVVGLCALAWRAGWVQGLYWPSLVAHHASWAASVARHPIAAPFVFIGVYALAVAISLPVGLWLSLLGGLLFGMWLGGLVTVVGASAGAGLLFWLARGLVGALLEPRFGRQIARLRPGLERDGFAYLLALRLMPVFPFWLVNLAPALIGMRFWPYMAATVVGMLPTSFVLSAIGAGLSASLASGRPPNAGMLLRPEILLPLAALAVLAVLPAARRQFFTRGRGGVKDVSRV